MRPSDPYPWERRTTDRLHVLHVGTVTSQGPAVVTLGQIRQQVARGWNVTLACPTDGWLGYAAREAGARVRWWADGRDGARARLADVRSLAATVRETDPEVVHTHGARAGMVGRLVVRGRRLTLHQPHGWTFDADDGSSVRWERFAARWVDSIICAGDDEQAVAVERGIDADTVVLPPGVDLSLWPLGGSKARAEARATLRVGEGPVALCVGRLVDERRQHDLLDAWPSVAARVPGADLYLVGDGPDRAALEERAATLDGAHVMGARTDVGDWMSACDVVVVPAEVPGRGLVPLEAMATGRSVVLVAPEGTGVPLGAGTVVAPGAVTELVDALVERLRFRGEADDEGLVGRSHVETAHDGATAAQELGRLYLRLLVARRRSTR